MKTNEKFSKEHVEFLNKHKRNTVFIWLMRFLVLFLIVFLWEFLAYVGIIDSFLMSSPSRIVKTIINLVKSGELSKHLFTTLYETVVGFLIATVLGTLIALLLWFSDNLKKILEPYVVILNSLPKIALGPVIIVWFGIGVESIIFMAVLITIIVTIITMLNGYLECEQNKELLLKSLGANKFQILRYLIIPSSMPTFISCLKINVGMAWIGSIMGEYLCSKQGIGYLIVYGGQVFKLDLVMASVVILCVLAGVMYALVSLIEKLLIGSKYK